MNFTKKCYDPNLHNVLKKALKNIFKRVLKEVKEGSVVERVLLADRHLHHPRERFGRICCCTQGSHALFSPLIA
jgi:hypothetical protein